MQRRPWPPPPAAPQRAGPCPAPPPAPEACGLWHPAGRAAPRPPAARRGFRGCPRPAPPRAGRRPAGGRGREGSGDACQAVPRPGCTVRARPAGHTVIRSAEGLESAHWSGGEGLSDAESVLHPPRPPHPLEHPLRPPAPPPTPRAWKTPSRRLGSPPAASTASTSANDPPNATLCSGSAPDMSLELASPRRQPPPALSRLLYVGGLSASACAGMGRGAAAEADEEATAAEEAGGRESPYSSGLVGRKC